MSILNGKTHLPEVYKSSKSQILNACKNGNVYKGYYCDHIDLIDREKWKVIPYSEYRIYYTSIKTCFSIRFKY